ncbi:hypothetical protein Bbelb_098550 [Branchiostoma belcheri]|nr:hypothetical protein Bbelb_098550 [Branchiostoma belcheri]
MVHEPPKVQYVLLTCYLTQPRPEDLPRAMEDREGWRKRVTCRTSGPMSYKDKLYINTPLLESHPLSKHAGITVYLKLENVQPSATFKIRGISHLCQKALKEGAKHFVCSSGGNAGLAAAYSARKLGVPATIIVPESTPTFTVERLRGEGATVEVVGKSTEEDQSDWWKALDERTFYSVKEVWDDSNQHTLKLAEQPGYIYIPPGGHVMEKPGAIILSVGGGGYPVCGGYEYTDMTVSCCSREGHASLVQELAGTLQDKPGAIILSVGGGGLLCGVVAGLRKVGWTDVPVVAMETQGADSFNAAVTAGKLFMLAKRGFTVLTVYRLLMFVSPVAKCLGAKTVAQEAFNLSKQHPIHSVVVTDEEAVEACAKFLDDERLLVEPACGAALAAVYSRVISRLQDQAGCQGASRRWWWWSVGGTTSLYSSWTRGKLSSASHTFFRLLTGVLHLAAICSRCRWRFCGETDTETSARALRNPLSLDLAKSVSGPPLKGSETVKNHDGGGFRKRSAKTDNKPFFPL